MPPKTKFPLADVIEAALSVARRDGIEKLTARAIADELQSSTMPDLLSKNIADTLGGAQAVQRIEIFLP